MEILNQRSTVVRTSGSRLKSTIFAFGATSGAALMRFVP